MPFFCLLFLSALVADAAIPQGPASFKVELFAGESTTTNVAAFSIDESGHFYAVETFRQPPRSTNFTSGTIEERVELLRKQLGADFKSLTNASERIRVIEDRNRDGKADFTRIFTQGFNRAIDGVGRSILARNGNLFFTCAPDLWLLHGTTKQSIHTGFGAQIGDPEHDLRGLTLGPDGRIYFAMGDRGLNVVTREGSPLIYLDEGVILRCEPDGAKLEVFARGFRNPRGLAFNDTGDLFAIDQDRLLFVVENADYGWRLTKNILPALPAITNLDFDVSCLAHSDGVSLPAKFQDAFFLGSSNGILALNVRGKGAGFEVASTEAFISNAAPTDIQFGPQTGIYFSEKAGRIYRAFDPQWKKGATPPGVEDVGNLAAILLKGTNETAVLRALWSLGQLGRKDNVAARQALLFAAQSRQAEVRAQAAKALGEAPSEQAGATLAKLLEDPEPRVRLFAALSLRRVKVPAAQEILFEMMKNPDPWLRHAAREAFTATATRN